MEVTLSPQVVLPRPMVLECLLPSITQALPQDFLPIKIHIKNIIFDKEDWYSPSSESFKKHAVFFFQSTYRMIQEQNSELSENDCWIKTKKTIHHIFTNDMKDMIKVYADATVFYDLANKEGKTRELRENYPIFLGFALKE